MIPFTERPIELGEANLAISLESSKDVKDIKEALAAQLPYLVRLVEYITSKGGASAADTSSAIKEAVETHIHNDIDAFRDLLKAGRLKTARQLLEHLKTRVWATATKGVRFRIATNIGAACLELGEADTAAQYFLEAIEYDPKDPTGMANAALAHLLSGHFPDTPAFS